MKFRLTYEGPLYSTQRDSIGDQKDGKAKHKHMLRQHFHKQLKQLWATDKFLKEATRQKIETVAPRAPSGKSYWSAEGDEVSLAQAVAANYEEYGYRFVPLVRESETLLCSLDVLFLRRDIPGSALDAGDIDNRMKTLIDGLRRPRNAAELVGNDTPQVDEDPFYCLLEDDKCVSHFSVETDTLLDPTGPGEADAARVKLVITVILRPYYVTMENLSYAGG